MLQLQLYKGLNRRHIFTDATHSFLTRISFSLIFPHISRTFIRSLVYFLQIHETPWKKHMSKACFMHHFFPCCLTWFSIYHLQVTFAAEPDLEQRYHYDNDYSTTNQCAESDLQVALLDELDNLKLDLADNIESDVVSEDITPHLQRTNQKVCSLLYVGLY